MTRLGTVTQYIISLDAVRADSAFRPVTSATFSMGPGSVSTTWVHINGSSLKEELLGKKIIKTEPAIFIGATTYYFEGGGSHSMWDSQASTWIVHVGTPVPAEQQREMVTPGQKWKCHCPIHLLMRCGCTCGGI